jgi:DNA-binding transcriptional LysR family regulator
MVDDTETIGGSLEDLRAFCAVAEFGTVSSAARQLGETKGSVSRRLSRLEQRLGVALLARTPRAVSLTEEGAAFYAKSHEALALLDDAAEGARQSRTMPSGHLRVTAPVDFGMDVLPELVVRFRARHPQITVELLLTDARVLSTDPTGCVRPARRGSRHACRSWSYSRPCARAAPGRCGCRSPPATDASRTNAGTCGSSPACSGPRPERRA